MSSCQTHKTRFFSTIFSSKHIFFSECPCHQSIWLQKKSERFFHPKNTRAPMTGENKTFFPDDRSSQDTLRKKSLYNPFSAERNTAIDFMATLVTNSSYLLLLWPNKRSHNHSTAASSIIERKRERAPNKRSHVQTCARRLKPKKLRQPWRKKASSIFSSPCKKRAVA